MSIVSFRVESIGVKGSCKSTTTLCIIGVFAFSFGCRSASNESPPNGSDDMDAGFSADSDDDSEEADVSSLKETEMQEASDTAQLSIDDRDTHGENDTIVNGSVAPSMETDSRLTGSDTLSEGASSTVLDTATESEEETSTETETDSQGTTGLASDTQSIRPTDTAVVEMPTDTAIEIPTDTDTGTGSEVQYDASVPTEEDTSLDASFATDTVTPWDAFCPVYVNGSLDDYSGHDGSSWSQAFETLQEGIDRAYEAVYYMYGMAMCEVWVAEGTYRPTRRNLGNYDPRAVSFMVEMGVALYGGFDGTESHRHERDFVSNKTVLSGDVGQIGDPSDNAYHVVLGEPESAIDGFTITGGNANVNYGENGMGGGMLNLDSSSVYVSNCIFKDNAAINGGGMYNFWWASTVTNCLFVGNTAQQNGGGMYNDGASPTLTNVTFTNNSAGAHGAGMANGFISSPSVVNSIIWGNLADGIYNDNSSAAVSFSVVQDTEYAGVNNNIQEDPLFVSSENQQLQTDSPCINAGDSTKVPADEWDLDGDGDVTEPIPHDLGGDTRIIGAAVDMGAFEYLSD